VFLHEGSPRRPTTRFGRANVSLKRGESRLSENARRIPRLEVELSPRRRELALARVLLAWARPFCLSEMLGEKWFGLDVSWILKSEQHACMSFIFKFMNWIACINGVAGEW